MGKRRFIVDKKEFGMFTAALKTYYPREDKLLPNQEAMELWYRQLQDIPYIVAETALNKWVATNKWSPSIADIRAMAVSITSGEPKQWSDGWEQVQKAIRNFGLYDVDGAMESFDDITRQAVKRLGFKELCMSENPMTDRANFRMIYEQIAEQKETEQMLPEALSTLIGNIRAKSLEGQKVLKGEQ